MGKLYVLYYTYDGACDTSYRVLCVSGSKSVLIRKMLDDLDGDPSLKVKPICATPYTDGDILSFSFEEMNGDGYLDYTIMPVSVYPGSVGA